MAIPVCFDLIAYKEELVSDLLKLRKDCDSQFFKIFK